MPVEADLWLLVLVVVPLGLIWWKLGVDKSFQTDAVFLFVVPLQLALIIDFVGAVKKSRQDWALLDWFVILLGLFYNVVMAIWCLYILLRASDGGKGAPHIWVFIIAIMYAVFAHFALTDPRFRQDFLASVPLLSHLFDPMGSGSTPLAGLVTSTVAAQRIGVSRGDLRKLVDEKVLTGKLVETGGSRTMRVFESSEVERYRQEHRRAES